MSDGPASAQQFPSGRMLLLPLFHKSPEAAYSAIAHLFASTCMTYFTPSVHILCENIPVSTHLDPSTVATATEVSVLNDMMIDDPIICALLLDAITLSWQPEPISHIHLLEACRKLCHIWVQHPSLFDSAAAILATTCSFEQWQCAQRCLSILKIALGCQIALISETVFPSGPIRPCSSFSTLPTLTASLVLSPSLSFPPLEFVLSQPFPNLSNVASSEITTKYTR